LIYCNCNWCEYNSEHSKSKPKIEMGICLTHTGECPKKVIVKDNFPNLGKNIKVG